ncbi:MAG: VCBS repeat-containing protein, partial [Woeseiaceae bacterium]|nr:VCBS repeat-containing protein [Woeseiaceae bacterium]
MNPVIGYRKRVSLLAVLATGIFGVVGQAAAETVTLVDAERHPVGISATPFRPRSGNEAAPFTRYDGSLFGLQQTNSFGPADFFPPFFNGGGISSGDIDRDGWPDIVSANGPLISIFMNQDGQRFEKLEVDLTGDNYTAIFNVALVDLNGDGWLDLFGTTYLDGNFYLLNNNGTLTDAGLHKPPQGQAVLSLTTSFGDVDRDGDLDVIVGNWFAGMGKQHPPPRSRNELWINEGDRFAIKPLSGLVGETLSTLLSDWSGDGWLDLIVGNDFDVPDFYYRGDGKGGFELVEQRDGIVPHSTHSTMSIDTGDFDNDLDLDIFLDQITARATGPSARMPVLALDEYCDDIVVATERDRCVTNMATRRSFFYGPNHRPDNVRKCAAVSDAIDQQACVGMQVTMTAQRDRNPEICDSIPELESRTYAMCRNFFEPVSPHDSGMLERAIPQRMNENVLLVWDASAGHFTDEAEQAGVGFTGWSW